MRKITLLMILMSFTISCEDRTIIQNQTRPGGYALGENVKLAFSVSGMNATPDSLAVMIFEKKTEYVYEIFAKPVDLQNEGQFECYWDGRKPDSSWPAGGRYWIYAIISDDNIVSDTVEIGLTD